MKLLRRVSNVEPDQLMLPNGFTLADRDFGPGEAWRTCVPAYGNVNDGSEGVRAAQHKWTSRHGWRLKLKRWALIDCDSTAGVQLFSPKMISSFSVPATPTCSAADFYRPSQLMASRLGGLCVAAYWLHPLFHIGATAPYEITDGGACKSASQNSSIVST